LVEFYEGLKKTSSAQLEVVFVSSDRDKHGFDEYFGSMPWLAAPYPPSESAGDAFGISGIPTLVVLEVGADVRAAKVITKDGRAKVMRDPRGESFPWKR
jgi:nucleoredoxin